MVYLYTTTYFTMNYEKKAKSFYFSTLLCLAFKFYYYLTIPMLNLPRPGMQPWAEASKRGVKRKFASFSSGILFFQGRRCPSRVGNTWSSSWPESGSMECCEGFVGANAMGMGQVDEPCDEVADSRLHMATPSTINALTVDRVRSMDLCGFRSVSPLPFSALSSSSSASPSPRRQMSITSYFSTTIPTSALGSESTGHATKQGDEQPEARRSLCIFCVGVSPVAKVSWKSCSFCNRSSCQPCIAKCESCDNDFCKFCITTSYTDYFDKTMCLECNWSSSESLLYKF